MNNDTAFNPEAFGAQTLDAPLDTKFIEIDEGEYPATIEKFEFRPLEKSGGLVLDVHWLLDSQEQKAKTGRDPLRCRQSIFLDRTEQGSLDTGKGKNVSLGRLREAIGMNKAGQPFAFAQLVGRAATVKVKNRKFEDDTFSEVKAVTQL